MLIYFTIATSSGLIRVGATRLPELFDSVSEGVHSSVNVTKLFSRGSRSDDTPLLHQ